MVISSNEVVVKGLAIVKALFFIEVVTLAILSYECFNNIETFANAFNKSI